MGPALLLGVADVLTDAAEKRTLVDFIDGNDPHELLFGPCSRCQDLSRQPSVQAEIRTHLRELRMAKAGGVVFTRIQEFLSGGTGDRHPTPSARRDSVVVADEAQRSQNEFIDDLARHSRDALPHAWFSGLTGTLIELAPANISAVFGDYLSVQHIRRGGENGSTSLIHVQS